MEAAHEPPAALVTRAGAGGDAEGVLELVAVAPLLDGRHDVLELIALQPPDPPQRIVDLGALDLELSLVGKHLPGNARMVGHGLDPLGARLEHLQRARVRIVALALVHHRAHAVAGDRARHEHHIPALAQPRDPLTAEGERLDLKLEHIAALGARRGVRPGGVRLGSVVRDARVGGGPHGEATNSSSSAFCAWRRFSA